MPNEIVAIFDWLLNIIPDWIIRIGLWFLGKFYYYFLHKTCGDVEGSVYNGRFCILSPGHYNSCKSDWEYNESLSKEIRFRWVFSSNTIYSRAEIRSE